VVDLLAEEDLVRERPILFTGRMVPPVLAGTKTMTRRIAKVNAFATEVRPAQGAEAPPGTWVAFYREAGVAGGREEGGTITRCPYGVPGDRLWGRETWGLASPGDPTYWFRGKLGGRTLEEMTLEWEVAYRADYGSNQENCHWRPSIFMPRWASRILLEITEVRLERLQDISREDAIAEGIERMGGKYSCSPWRNYLLESEFPAVLHSSCPRHSFMTLFESINPGAWEANPWVWVIVFRLVTATTPTLMP
jgi:hypothetical protein